MIELNDIFFYYPEKAKIQVLELIKHRNIEELTELTKAIFQALYEVLPDYDMIMQENLAHFISDLPPEVQDVYIFLLDDLDRGTIEYDYFFKLHEELCGYPAYRMFYYEKPFALGVGL